MEFAQHSANGFEEMHGEEEDNISMRAARASLAAEHLGRSPRAHPLAQRHLPGVRHAVLRHLERLKLCTRYAEFLLTHNQLAPTTPVSCSPPFLARFVDILQKDFHTGTSSSCAATSTRRAGLFATPASPPCGRPKLTSSSASTSYRWPSTRERSPPTRSSLRETLIPSFPGLGQ